MISKIFLSDGVFINMEKTCRTCGRKKNITQFHNNRAARDGKANSCKICANIKINEYKKKNYTRDILPRLTNVGKKDWYEMFLFLQKIGYDLNRPIHEQFCEKHNLPPKRDYTCKVKYTWDDLSDLETI